MPKGKLSFFVTNYNVCLWPLCMLSEMLTYHFHKLGGPDYGGLKIGEWKNRVNRWAVDKEKYDEVARFYLDKFENNPVWFKKAISQIPKKCAELIKFTSSVFAADLSKVSNKKLYNLYKKYQEKFTEMYIYGWLPNAVEGLDFIFTKWLEGILRTGLKRLKKEKLAKEYVSVLVAPIKDSFRVEEAKDFLRLLEKVKKNQSKKNDLLERHAKKYGWLPFDYDGPAWDKKYFVSVLESMLKQNLLPKKELQKLNEERLDLIKKQRTCLKELNLAQKEKKIFEIARELMYWKDYRKDILFQSYYHLDKLIKEIGRRLGLSSYQVKHILPNEMKGVLVNKEVDASELNKRISHSILVYGKKGIKIFTGKKAEKIKETYTKEDEISQGIKELIGECAYSGSARGEVLIVNTPEDVPRMKRGNILVSVATNPNLLSAMKMAAAIITDKGGITCHAAIVARELKIPCLIGAKIATKILKDGDWVGVNATKGVARVLKK